MEQGARIVGGESVRVQIGGIHPYPFYAQLFSRATSLRVASALRPRSEVGAPSEAVRPKRIAAKELPPLSAAATSSRWSFVCGGAVISSWPGGGPSSSGPGFWVLTAAHCLVGDQGDPGKVEYAVNVLWNPSRLPPPGSAIPGPASLPAGSDAIVSAANAPFLRLVGPQGITIFPHPEYEPGGVSPLAEMLGLYPPQAPRDAALLRVSMPAGEVLPAWMMASAQALPPLGVSSSPPSAPRSLLRIVGHGLMHTDAASPSPLLQQLDVARRDDLLPGFPASRLYSSMHAVVGAPSGGGPSGSFAPLSAPAGACFGDSGGPLLQLTEEGEGALSGAKNPGWRVLGPLCCSLSATCGDARAPDLYASLADTWGADIPGLIERNSPPAADLPPMPSAGNVWAYAPRAPFLVWGLIKLAALALAAVAIPLLLVWGVRRWRRRARQQPKPQRRRLRRSN